MEHPSDEFLDEMRALEGTYLRSADPIEQSGFSGGATRWRAEREPILDAVHHDGDFLDVGCANGYLLECLVEWAAERAIVLVPHGIDLGPDLIHEAQRRSPDHAAHLHVGEVWSWHAPRRYDYVYSLTHLAPPGLLGELCRRMLRWVTPGGRLIIGDYSGSRTRGTAPQDLGPMLESLGFDVSGTAVGGAPPVTAFAWVDA